MQNFAECIAGKGEFCGRNAAASCAKNYGDNRLLYVYPRNVMVKFGCALICANLIER